MKKILSLLLAAIMLLSLGAAAYAEDADPADPNDETPKEVYEETDPEIAGTAFFINESNPQPDLIVRKNVTAPEGSPDISDIDFKFRVKIDGAYYTNKQYALLDERDNEIVDPTKDSCSTDGQGYFTLKAGQAAKFPFVGEKSYEIEEVEIPQNFYVSSAVQSGIIGENGVTVVYENTYTPPGQAPGGLTVKKEIIWPSAYKYAEMENQTFTFTLTLDGKPVKNEPYKYSDPSTSETVRSTNDKGEFTLPGSGTAKFEELDPGKEYIVTEAAVPKWHEIDVPAEGHKGNTSDNNTEIFRNTNASFVVQKTMSSGTTTELFTFTLVKGSAAWANAEYWLYDTGSKSRIMEGGAYVSHYTDSKGEFRLGQNQAAVFIDLPVGQTFSVRETPSEDFEQTTPANKQGYVNETVKDHGVVYSFINKPADIKGTLTVSKYVTHDGFEPLSNEPFTFVIKRKTADGTEPLQKAYYLIDNSDEAHLTGTGDNAGQFTLTASQTAKFTMLIAGEYIVEELNPTNPGYVLKKITVNGEESDAAYGTVGKDGLSFTFTNKYTARNVTLVLNKVSSADDSAKPLPGAVFALYRDEKCEVPLESVGTTYTTDAEGKISIPGLREGVFYLREEKSPEGYARIPGTVKITIDRYINSDGKETMSAVAESNLAEKVLVEAKSSFTTDGDNNGTLSLILNDEPAKIYALPSTGGIGTGLFTLLGLAIMATMIFLFVKEKKKEN